ncbi:MAG: hypothetical protein ACOYL8_04850 [Patescibacteria group bacterium]
MFKEKIKNIPAQTKVEQKIPDNENLEEINEKKVDEEISNLENNISDLKKEIEEIGGEEKLAEEINKNDVMATRWADRIKRTKYLISSIALAIPTLALGFADANILPLINWEVADDKQLGQNLVYVTVLGLLGSIATITEFIKNQKRVNEANRFSSI